MLRAMATVLVLFGAADAAELPHDPARPMPLPPIKPEGKEAFLSSDYLYGRLLDNRANEGRQGSGFNPLCHARYPGMPIFNLEATGLNFEHIFNGVALDNQRAMFTPRKDPVVLSAESTTEASLFWPAEGSKWGIECRMTYRFAASGAIDMAFTATPSEDHFPKGYAAFMWAGYMACARDRRIHFYGLDGDREGWIAFGEDTPNGPETGTVACAGVKPLPYDADAQALNIVEHPTKRFIKPVYYGLIDGDHDLGTQQDTLAYVMMFDSREPIRFAEWNFVRNQAGEPDTHRPAWDWQFVVQNPQPGTRYGYRARMTVQPFTSREDILALYEDWRKELGTP